MQPVYERGRTKRVPMCKKSLSLRRVAQGWFVNLQPAVIQGTLAATM